jgi:hypothetical protein
MSKRLDTLKSECEKESAVLYDVRHQSAKQQAFVNNLKNNDPEYIKLRKTIEEEMLKILSDKRALLNLALLSIAESIRDNPDKYSSLVTNHNNNFYPPSSLATATYDSSTDSSSRYVYQP